MTTASTVFHSMFQHLLAAPQDLLLLYLPNNGNLSDPLQSCALGAWPRSAGARPAMTSGDGTKFSWKGPRLWPRFGRFFTAPRRALRGARGARRSAAARGCGQRGARRDGRRLRAPRPRRAGEQRARARGRRSERGGCQQRSRAARGDRRDGGR